METRKYWGWGLSDYKLNPKILEKSLSMVGLSLGMKIGNPITPISVDKLLLPLPRFTMPPELKLICFSDNYNRANHTYGKAFRDVWRAVRGQFDQAPDYVAYPKTEMDIMTLMEFSGVSGIALIPYGGGSSVVGGVEPRLSAQYNGCISVDMKHFDMVLEVDDTSRSARIQAGIYGPAMEAQLKKHGYTLRHFPQSFEFSTLGGWLATHAGGHFATLYTHIDDFVQSIRMVTPNGSMETRRLPGSGAGPKEENIILGSEGAFGIITEAWMRLQDIPQYKKTKTVGFPTWEKAVEACRQLSQSGLYPTNARLVSAIEATINNLGEGRDTLILGFESHHHPVDDNLTLALSICKALGGTWNENDPKGNEMKQETSADQWKKSFLQAPYLRDELVRYGVIVETFETATTWDKFTEFNKAIEEAANEAIKKYCGNGFITCRFTHLYPDGPAPYYTVFAAGKKDSELEQWDNIKKAVSSTIVENGGTITHHHAVGRDHQPYYKKQHSDVFEGVLRKVKTELDPNWILNPGVLVENKTLD